MTPIELARRLYALKREWLKLPVATRRDVIKQAGLSNKVMTDREAQRRQVARRLQAGMCAKCGGPREPDRKYYCGKCSARKAELARARAGK